jgi:2-hydroxychromene-2-carboxylate isomerase
MRFYFDFVSPYAYLAWTQLFALAERHRREVELAPVLFAGLLGAHGSIGPAEIPAKRRHLFTDVVRTARRIDVPFAIPPSHPFNPLLALRVVSLPAVAPARRALVDALYAAVWAGGPGVTDAAEVARIADRVGLDGAALVAEAATAEAKDRVRRATDDAIAAGVFGVPSVIVDGELFWGFDAFANLEAFLRGAGAIEPALKAQWETLGASASRKQAPR